MKKKPSPRRESRSTPSGGKARKTSAPKRTATSTRTTKRAPASKRTTRQPRAVDTTRPVEPVSTGRRHRRDDAFPIVGLGASAGGLEALELFLKHVPERSGMAFVIIEHLDPLHKGNMVELLQRTTPMPVAQVKDGTRARPDCVYVIPPGKDMSILRGVLHLVPQASPRGLKLPIDFFFRSLAADQEERGIAVVLSGMGSDGTLGIRAIKEKAGAAFVQSLSSAKFDGMPRSAIDSGMADVVAPVEELPGKIIAYHRHARHITRPEEPLEGNAKGSLEKIYILLRAQTGNDFSLYKKSTIHRRIERRMGLHQIDKLPNYVRFLRENAREVELLFRELLIGVTSFFRDPPAWTHLKKEALPQLLGARSSGALMRAWVPGCSTGEEAYSLAIAFKEALDILKPGKRIALQVFATDLDHDSIEKARQGFYPANIAADVSPERLRRFFVQEERGYRVHKDIREMVVFAPQNLIMDPPFTKLDILCCRNLLIYLAPELQRKIIPLFHYSLNPNGVLFLGSAETIGSFTGLFVPVDGKTRIYRRLQGGVGAVPVEFPTPLVRKLVGGGDFRDNPPAPFTLPPANLQVLADHLLVQRFSPAAILASDKGDILYISGRTGKYLEPAVGKASMNVFAMARDGLRLELTSAFSTALRDDHPVTVRGIKVGTNGGTQVVDLTVQRITEPKELHGTMMIILADVAASEAAKGARHGPQPGVRSTRLEHELQRAHDEIQTTREEMQTSQEELKSTNEELQSTNEELQSTNEELTTSKEEMQSMNEELQTVNHELQSKVDELSRANNDMKNLLNSTDIATLFLDGDLLVRRFTTPTANIIKLIPSDAGRPISDIAREIEYPELTQDTREVLRTLVFKERLVPGTRNRWFSVRIMPYRTLENVIDGVVITFTDASSTKKLEDTLRDQASELRQMVESLPHLVWECRPDGTCDYVSQQWVDYTGAPALELQGNGWLLAIHPDERESVRDAWRSALKAGKPLDLEQRVRGKDGGYRWFRLHCTPIRDGSRKITRWYGINSDVHALKVAVEQRKEAADRLVSLLGHVSEPFLTLADGETISYANATALRLFGHTQKLVGKRLAEVLSAAEASHILDAIRQVTREGREKVLDAHFKQLASNGRLKVRVFPAYDGIAILFQGRPGDRSTRGSDGTTTER